MGERLKGGGGTPEEEGVRDGEKAEFLSLW